MDYPVIKEVLTHFLIQICIKSLKRIVLDVVIQDWLGRSFTSYNAEIIFSEINKHSRDQNKGDQNKIADYSEVWLVWDP